MEPFNMQFLLAKNTHCSISYFYEPDNSDLLDQTANIKLLIIIYIYICIFTHTLYSYMHILYIFT